MLYFQDFDSFEEIMEEIRRRTEAADSRVEPWQAEIKPGDFFLEQHGEITIYGEVIESPYEEDREMYRKPHMKHFRLTRCFSVACPEGEMGDKHVSAIMMLLSKDQFEQARKMGWPDARVLLTIEPVGAQA